MEEEKVKRVLKQLTPKEFKDIQKFLGLANYYQQFIKDFATIARLLHNLVKKNQKQDQTERQEKIFQELKKRFTKELVLAVLDLDKKMRMEANVLDYVTSSFLSIVLKLKVVDLTFSYSLSHFNFIFDFSFYFSIFRMRVRVRVMRSCCHTSVTSDDMVIVMVTSHMIHERV